MNHDIVITRGSNEDSYGYMFDWGQEGQAPVSIESNPPDVALSTSSGITQAGGEFSARDAAPPYPIEVNNWQDGAGQESYDTVDASPEAFRSSRNISVIERGRFELTPRTLHFADTWMSNKVYAALGTFWASFLPDGEDPRKTLRFLHRYTMTTGSSVGSKLETTSGTSLAVLDATDLDDRVLSEKLDAPIPQATAACTQGDYLYCPVHNELVRVTAVSGVSLTVVRAQAGTTAAEHVGGCVWDCFNWTPVSFNGTDPSAALSALATDGEYVYAAFSSFSTDGSVFKGKAVDTEDAWTSYSAANNISALCYCGGYMYGAQDKLSSVTSAGYFTSASPAVYTPISLTGALTPGVTTAGMVAVGNFVYWVVTDESSRSWVYRIQHSSADTFELVAEMPPGFVATCAHQHLGYLYVGGYLDSVYTTIAEDSLPRYEGALYRVNVDGSSDRVVRLRLPFDEQPPDTRVKGLTSSGPYIYMLTNEDVYIYDTQHDGWHHYADTDTATVSTVSEDIVWNTYGFDYTDPAIEEIDLDPFKYDDKPTYWLTEVSGWEEGTAGYMDVSQVTVTEASSSGYDYNDYGYVWDPEWIHSVSAGKWHRWSLSGLPSTQATLEVDFDNLQSQAGCVVMAGTDKEVRVQFRGFYTGGSVTYYQVQLGYTTDPTSKSVSNYLYRLTGELSVAQHTARITLSSVGAKVYIDGSLALSADYGELMDAISPNTVQWAVGWPGNSKTDSVPERISYDAIRFTPAGAYAPDYAGGTLTTTSLKNIAAMQGLVIVPIPGNGTASEAGTYGGWDCMWQHEVNASGWLETSDSAFHMGSIQKFFTSVIVEHSALRSGQTLTVTPYVDGVAQSSVTAQVGENTTTAVINTLGKKVRVRVALSETDPDRVYEYRLRVYRITARFFTENSPNVHTYYLNCREGVQLRNGRDWGTDPEDAIRHLFAAADTGETVYIADLFTSNTETGHQVARIEQVRLYQGPGDTKRYDHLEGTCMIKARAVDG